MMLTKEHAEQIAKKLQAVIKTKRAAHDVASIYVDNRLVAVFGIRRGSKKDQGHDHIPKSIHFSPSKCLQLARCTLERPDWIKELRKNRLI